MFRGHEMSWARYDGNHCYKTRDIVARLKSRSLSKAKRKSDSIDRLCGAMEKEREAFEEKAASFYK